MQKILVTGGAGYIGSHVVKMLAERGFEPVVYDSLVTGFRESVEGYGFIEGDIGDYEKLMEIFNDNDIACVMNFASFIAVGESVQAPLKYYDNNVARTMNLFRAMEDAGVRRFIFSSTAAVYGMPREIPITEESPLAPINPYGRTKLFIEEVLRDMDRAGDFKSVSLRYFNAAGADPSGTIGERHQPETHLVPLVLRSIIDEDFTLRIFGTDYDTPDGTGVRDYIHVNDLADAHILALEYLLDGGATDVFNLGNGSGYSVREIIEAVQKVTGKKPRYTEAPRREGDPATLVASSRKAQDILRWNPRHTSIDAIVASAWNWEKQQKRRGW